MTALGSTKPIEAIAAGDMVLSYNEFTKAYGANPVVNTFVNKTDVLAQVRVNGELIESTTSHPYYTKNAGWKYAGDLKRGDIVLLADGSESIIEESAKLRFLDNEISVYNFEVANDHTYFVGNTGVLVHNSGCAAGSLLSNSAGLTGEQLAALLGIGTVAAGGAVAGTIIVDGIDSGTITLPGTVGIEKDRAISKDITYSIPSLEKRVYQIAYLEAQTNTKDRTLIKSGIYLNYAEALAVLKACSLFNTSNNSLISIINSIGWSNNMNDAKKLIEEARQNGQLSRRYVGIYTLEEQDAVNLAYATGAVVTEYELHGDKGYYKHFHDLSHTIHIWYGVSL